MTTTAPSTLDARAIAAIEARQRARMEPFVRRAVHLIMAKLEDARSHAENALTRTLKETPDGRPTAAGVRRSRSFAAASNRLDELQTTLAGPAVTSTNGLIHDAAEAWYADSRDLWWGLVPPEFRVNTMEPTVAQRSAVRGLLWFGLPVRTGLDQSFSAARNGLLIAISQAGGRDATRTDAHAALDAWEARHRSALIKRVGLALNDANQRADLQAMRDTIRPELQGD